MFRSPPTDSITLAVIGTDVVIVAENGTNPASTSDPDCSILAHWEPTRPLGAKPDGEPCLL
jgi:hypothetical protein